MAGSGFLQPGAFGGELKAKPRELKTQLLAE
jgi:hypothetical protein